MKCSSAQKLINDHIDGQLAAGQIRRLESHLERCANCMDIFLDMGSIVNNAKRLDTLDPSEELWPAIKRQVLKKNREARTQKKGLFGNFPLHARGPAFALSTLLVIMLMIPILYYGIPHMRNANNDPEKIALNNFKIAERQYQSAIDALDRAIEARNVKLSPELAAVFKKNLAIIDNSIRICKKSIDKYPGVRETNKLLLICYRKKIELLNEIKDITMQS